MTRLSLSGSLPDRIAQLRQTLPPHVRLVAVTKQKPVEMIRAAYAAGVRDFGENRVQEAEEKQAQLADLPDITWHLLGHLQTNKALKALEHFHWIHSLDSLKLATRLNRLAEERSLRPTVLLQVKFRPDPNKYGWDPLELQSDLPALDQLSHLAIAGMMTIPPLGLSEAETLAVFQDAQQFFQTVQQAGYRNLAFHHLSMGMSDDYPLAIQAGSTVIRLGRVLFGDRP
ncbi:YggS family pyridoxal phosphate-dependent enzyme [Leptolyngbya sp. CCY15150]|uniref:YggS family pyridoxal phosphate-dependent enzyme n=1 Tax=Leptolyngbya sp. CCY15150 TaxID=2767772 RepID=UPI00194E5267|nr:YggS family pyridoxal phosphate-dependent enzyme [Leptolyngbya sp. CCY15150]